VRHRTHDNIDATAVIVQRALNADHNQSQARAAKAESDIGVRTQEFKSKWPAEAADLVPGAGDVRGFLEILQTLEADRLPDFEDKFRELLRRQSQRNVGELAEQIRRASKEIRERIREVNASLKMSEFDQGRHLRIAVKESKTQVLTDFLQDLGAIASGSWGGPGGAAGEDPAEAEEKFALMNRVMGRLGSKEPADRRWRDLCLDTRRHVKFIGEEVDTDGIVVNVHDSTSGLSGGQQQKLAVFCLAAALRYQLAPDLGDVPAFGTVIMDEAFDRADSDFTRMAMDVFVSFGFHMILATPLKALQTLEDYVDGIGFVACRDHQASRVDQVSWQDASLRSAVLAEA
jgi:uncharacterized protein YPO0396